MLWKKYARKQYKLYLPRESLILPYDTYLLSPLIVTARTLKGALIKGSKIQPLPDNLAHRGVIVRKPVRKSKRKKTADRLIVWALCIQVAAALTIWAAVLYRQVMGL